MKIVLACLGWWWWRRGRGDKVEVSSTARKINEATVEQLLEAVRGMLSEEGERATSLNGRAAGLTGFIGVILSIAAATGAALGKSAGTGLHHGVRILVGSLVAGALISLVLAVVAVVAKVLLPTQGFVIETAEVKKYPTWEFIEQDRVMVQGYLMRGYITALERDRVRHESKATWLGRSYKMVCVGLLLVATAGTAATLDRYVASRPRPAHQPQIGGRHSGASTRTRERPEARRREVGHRNAILRASNGDDRRDGASSTPGGGRG